MAITQKADVSAGFSTHSINTKPLLLLRRIQIGDGALEDLRGHADALAQRRVRVHRAEDLFGRRLEP